MDGDNQNDPADIPAMILMSEQQDLDIVCGWRKDRKDAFINRRLPSMIANAIISYATGVKLHDYGCSLKVFGGIVNQRRYGEMHRFLRRSPGSVRSARGRPITARVRTPVELRIIRTSGRARLMTVKCLSSYKPVRCRFSQPGFMLGAPGVISLGSQSPLRFSSRTARLFVGLMMALTGVHLILNDCSRNAGATTESQDKPPMRRAIRGHARTKIGEKVGA